MATKPNTTTYTLRDIPADTWIEYQVICKRDGISAAESIRRHIAETVHHHQTAPNQEDK